MVPAVIVLLEALGKLFLSDDYPKGNYKELEAHGAMVRKPSNEVAKLYVSNTIFSWDSILLLK